MGIQDGGQGMYAAGNIIETSFAGAGGVPYTAGTLSIAGNSFGVGGQYFTIKTGPLWILGADVFALLSFFFVGRLSIYPPRYVCNRKIDEYKC